MRLAMAAVLLAATARSLAGAYHPAPGALLFEAPALPRFRIVIASNDLRLLRRGSTSYVPAEVTVNGRAFRQVGVRLKGHGSFQPLERKPSLALKFDAHVPGQRVHGLNKLLLNNASQDSTLMSEFVASALFNAARIPAARVGHARVELNGRDLGFYVLAEAMNKTFLRQHFRNPDGNLYEGYARDITGPLEQDSGESSAQEDVRRLLTIATLPQSERAGLPEIFDVDRFLSFLAISMLGSHHDSYPLNRNNYRLYADPDTGRFVMMPHGIDGSFSRASLPLTPPNNSILTRAVLATDEQQRAYRERIALLFTNVFTLEFMTNRVHSALPRLESATETDSERSALRTRANAFIRRIVQRHDAVARELRGEKITVLAVSRNTPVGDMGWHDELTKGGAEFRRVEVNGVSSLHIRTEPEPATASWRRAIRLAPGKYRFEGRVRIVSMEGSARSGAGLRISGVSGTTRIGRTAEWEKTEFVFTVPESAPDVVLICEARGANVEAWFDLDSLRLSRE
jgi:hypothetical protein